MNNNQGLSSPTTRPSLCHRRPWQRDLRPQQQRPACSKLPRSPSTLHPRRYPATSYWSLESQPHCSHFGRRWRTPSRPKSSSQVVHPGKSSSRTPERRNYSARRHKATRGRARRSWSLKVSARIQQLCNPCLLGCSWPTGIWEYRHQTGSRDSRTRQWSVGGPPEP